MNLIKNTISSAVIALFITAGCYLLPLLSHLLSGYLPAVFTISFLLIMVMSRTKRNQSSEMLISDVEFQRRVDESKTMWAKSSKATSCPSDCYDLRNIDRQLHTFDGLKD